MKIRDSVISLSVLSMMSLMLAVAGCGSSGAIGISVETLAGRGTEPVDQLKEPDGVTVARVDGQEVAYITDMGNHQVKLIEEDGAVTLIGGTGDAGYANGPADAAEFNYPDGITTDTDGNIYVADTLNNAIRKIDISTGEVTTIAGGDPGPGGAPGEAGSADGMGSEARFNEPTGITIDSFSNLYVADQGNHTIRKIDQEGNVTTIVGAAGEAGLVDGPAGQARLNEPHGLTIDSNGNLYITEWGNNTVRMIEMTDAQPSDVATLANGEHLNQPHGIAVSAAGDVFVADEKNNAIKVLRSDAAEIEIYAGTGDAGDEDGDGENAKFNKPRGLALGFYKGEGHPQDVYVCDYGNNSVRIVKSK